MHGYRRIPGNWGASTATKSCALEALGCRSYLTTTTLIQGDGVNQRHPLPAVDTGAYCIIIIIIIIRHNDAALQTRTSTIALVIKFESSQLESVRCVCVCVWLRPAAPYANDSPTNLFT